jgi:hypothetical protein
MGSITDAVPPADPGDAILASMVKGALGMVPVVGPLAGEGVGAWLAQRQARQTHDFLSLLASELEKVIAEVDAAGEEVHLDPDEFTAVATRAMREAAETASGPKRARLARAVANGGSWAQFTTSEREQFTRCVSTFGDLHVFLLHYFADPRAWFLAHGIPVLGSSVGMSSVLAPLEAALAAPRSEWEPAVTQAMMDLEREQFAQVRLDMNMTPDGTLQPRTLPKGLRFLEYVREDQSASVNAPSVA